MAFASSLPNEVITALVLLEEQSLERLLHERAPPIGVDTDIGEITYTPRLNVLSSDIETFSAEVAAQLVEVDSPRLNVAKKRVMRKRNKQDAAFRNSHVEIIHKLTIRKRSVVPRLIVTVKMDQLRNEVSRLVIQV